jgi:purine nucleosidase
MGGAIREGGNITAQAEFNIYADPHAAHVVFHSGIPITLIPLDVTNQCMLYAKDIQRLPKANSSISKFIDEATAVYLEFTKEKTGIDGCALHDPLTLATIIAPELLALEEHYVDVDISSGISMGNTFADFYHTTGKPANMKVALDVRGEEFVELFLERMETLTVCTQRLSGSKRQEGASRHQILPIAAQPGGTGFCSENGAIEIPLSTR